jgi:hypothetical protein
MERIGRSFCGRAGAILAIVTCGVFAVPHFSMAGPIPAEPLVTPVAGESDLTSFIPPHTSDVGVDWMVVDYAGGLLDGLGQPIPVPVGGAYLYMYQLENTSIVAVDLFTVTFPSGTVGSVIAAGGLAGDDLDAPTLLHPAHAGTVNPVDDAAGGPFPVLNGEEGPFVLAPLASLVTNVDAVSGNVTWTFTPLAVNRESDTLYYLSTLPPIYGDAVAQDSTPPSPWGTRAPGADKVPVPVPEPASWLLWSIGLAGALIALRRRRVAA